MTRIKQLFFIGLITMPLLHAKSQTHESMQHSNFSPEQTNVMNAVLKMTEAFHKKDLDGVMASYESKAVIVFEPGMPVSDPNAIRAGFQGFFDVNPTFEYFGHEVFVNGNLAIHLAPWKMRGTTPDGQEISQSGLSIAVLKKQKDGSWLMVFDDPYGQNLLSNHPD